MTEEQFRRQEARAVSRREFYSVSGVSWKGRITRRDGKVVSCGHKHRTEKAAQPCLQRMRRERPGNCQAYRISHLILLGFRK